MIANRTALAVGAWILLSPWILGFSHLSFAKWSNIAAGLILVIVNVWALFGEKKSSIL